MQTQKAIKLIFSANAVIAMLYILMSLNKMMTFSSPFLTLISVSLLLTSCFGMFQLNKKKKINNG